MVDNSAKVCTAFGTLITIFVNITQDSLLTTAILAAAGGASSFMATMLTKAAVSAIKKYL